MSVHWGGRGFGHVSRWTAAAASTGPAFASEAAFIADVFQSGAVAGWVLGLDDKSSQFKANDGATNIAADGDTVGLLLEKSLMAGATASAFITAQTDLVDTLNTAAVWMPSGTNTVVDDTGAVKVTYGNNNSGARSNTSAANGLTTDLTVGTFYVFVGQAKVSAGGSVVQFVGAVTLNSSTFTTSFGPFQLINKASNATANYVAAGAGLASGQSAWVQSMTFKAVPGKHFVQSGATLRPKWHTGNIVTADGLDDYLGGVGLASSSANTMMLRVDVPASISGTQVLAGLSGSSTARFYIALNTSGKLCAGVGSDSTSTIVGTTDVRGKTGTVILRHDGTTVKLDWVEDGQAISHEYSGAQNGNPSTTVTFNLFGLNNNGTPGSYTSASLHPMSYHVQRAVNDNDVLLHASFLRSY